MVRVPDLRERKVSASWHGRGLRQDSQVLLELALLEEAYGFRSMGMPRGYTRTGLPSLGTWNREWGWVGQKWDSRRETGPQKQRHLKERVSSWGKIHLNEGNRTSKVEELWGGIQGLEVRSTLRRELGPQRWRHLEVRVKTLRVKGLRGGNQNPEEDAPWGGNQDEHIMSTLRRANLRRTPRGRESVPSRVEI